MPATIRFRILYLSSPLLHKNIKFKMHSTNFACFIALILPVLYGCETWSLILREEHHRLRVFKDKVLRKIFRYKKEDVEGDWKDFIRSSSMVYIA